MATTWMRHRIPPCVLAAVVLVAGCATNPATGERQLSLVSVDQEIAIGRQASQQVQQTIGLVANQELQQYVQQVGRGLASDSERPELPWTFGVVEDPAQNAFALPGGFVYITRGLLNLLTSEAELASVLGHEIAHVTARHSVEQMSRAQLAQLGLGIGGVFFPEVQQLSPLVGAGLDLLFLKYGRDDERQADEIGFGYVRAAGYDVSVFPDVFATLQRASGEKAGALPGWLSTHPTSAERVQAAEKRVAAVGRQPQARLGRDVYLRHINGLVYGENPRHGFFRDAVFYHPELRLQMTFPSGWQTQNLAQAVVAAAPNGAAAIEMTMADAKDAGQALNAFAAQNGVQVGAVSRGSLQAGPSVTARFRASAGGATVDGYAAFVEYGGRTYRIIGYAASQAFGSYDSAIAHAIESFGPVTDARILSVQPKRIDIVELKQSRTLADFAEQFPSAVSIEELAVINQVSGPSARLGAGTLVKRIVS